MPSPSRVTEQASKIPRVGDKASTIGRDITKVQVREKRESPYKLPVHKGKGKDPQGDVGGPRLGSGEKDADLQHSAKAAQKAAEKEARAAFNDLAGGSATEDVEEDLETPFLASLEDEEQAREEEGVIPDDEEEPKEGGADTEHAKANEALRRGQIPESTIKSLSKEAALDMAQQVSRLMGDAERAYQQSLNATKALEAVASRSESPEAPVLGKAGHPSDAKLADMRKGLDAELGKDLVDSLLSIVEAKSSPNAAMQTRLDEMGSVLDGITQTNAAKMMGDQRDRLENGLRMEGLYPQVSDDATWRSVVENVDRLAKSGAFSDPDACFLAAAAMTIGPAQPAAPSRSRKSASNNAKRNGQPTTPNRRQTVQNPDDAAMSQMRRAYRHLQKNPGDWKGGRAVSGRGGY